MARPEGHMERRYNRSLEQKNKLKTGDDKMVKLITIYLGFLFIKAVLINLPTLAKKAIFRLIPKRKYTAEEVIRCGHMKPDLYYKKQLTQTEPVSLINKLKKHKLKPKEIITLEHVTTNTYREVDVNVIREQFKKKMKNRQLTRTQIIAIRKYLEHLVDCTGKKFSNDCHCIYYCLKRLKSEQIMDLSTLENLLK